MKAKLEKLKNLRDKIQSRIEDVDYMLIRFTLDDDLLNERIRLHKVLNTIYMDIGVIESEMRTKAAINGLASHLMPVEEAEEEVDESDEYSSWKPKN